MAKQPHQFNLEKKTINSLIEYSDNILSDHYISQFLNPKATHINYENENSLLKPDFEEPPLLASPLDEQENEEEKLTSSFHNFQKHLVTTLRKCISFVEINEANRLGEIENILWNFFMRCPKMTRTLIYLVFGGLSFECSKIKKFNRKYGLEKLIKCYCQTEIKKAQKNIRIQTLNQLTKIDVNWEINQRRMRDKEGFRIYFEAFVEELKSGGFNKRLPKEKKEFVKRKLGKQNRNNQTEPEILMQVKESLSPERANNFE